MKVTVPISLPDLCRALCRELNIDDIDEAVADRCLSVDEVTIALDVDEDDPSALICFVDLGALDDESRMDAMELALATNLSLEGSEHGVIGWHEETDRLVLSKSLCIEADESPAVVADRLRRLAAFARDFDENIARAHDDGLESAPAGFAPFA